MPEVKHSRTLNAVPGDLWGLVSDPHHLPRWWPRVSRVEAVDSGAFTEVLLSDKGRFVRADFTLLQRDEREMKITWAQQIAGTPFAKVLRSATTEVCLQPLGAKTSVTIVLRQSLRGTYANLGTLLMKRAASTTVKEALDGLERIAG